MFDTSPLTIRGELEMVQKNGILTRFYVGARLVDAASEGNLFSSHLVLNKHAIAIKASQMVENGDSIFINTSSTALLMLNYITASHVTVITNNAKSIFIENHAPDMAVVLTGGELRFPKSSMVGDFALTNLNRVTADKCFLGCAGITAEEGITTNILQEASINETMLRRTNGPRYILADNSKIGIHQNFVSGTLDSIDILITDVSANPKELAKLIARGVKVEQVKPVKKIG